MTESNAHDSLMEEVIAHEWAQFDKVQNEGGRASCQDDWETFHIMRSSQFFCWPYNLLKSYLKDLCKAEAGGWNLVTEKYARMMESTAPEEYEALKERLPERSPERLARQEQVIAIEVAWNEDIHRRFPKYSSGSRPVHTSEDTPWATSSETYLRGELTTWSDETFALYEEWIRQLAAEGKNRAYINADAIAKQYGYKSLEDVEGKL